jgi:hypothetical protein
VSDKVKEDHFAFENKEPQFFSKLSSSLKEPFKYSLSKIRKRKHLIHLLRYLQIKLTKPQLNYRFFCTKHSVQIWGAKRQQN